MSFPSSLPSYTGFTSTHTLSQDSHASQHNSEQTDIIALATKMGTGASTPTSGVILRGNGVGTSTWDTVHLSTDVQGVLGVANGGTGGQTNFLAIIYPVGCIYTEVTGVNPSTTFGFGTWVAYGAGQVLVGNGTSDQTFVAGNTGGESNHKLTTAEMPAHTHDTANIPANGGAYAGGGFTAKDGTQTITSTSTGGGGTHNNLQPYIVVYFWRRTA